MSQSVLVKIDLPKDWSDFRLPRALHDRLQELLDRHGREGKLTARERREAKALTQLVDMLSLMKLRAEHAAPISRVRDRAKNSRARNAGVPPRVIQREVQQAVAEVRRRKKT